MLNCLFFNFLFRLNNKRYNVRVKLYFDKDIYEIFLLRLGYNVYCLWDLY